MLIKNMEEISDSLNTENLNIIRRIIEDFENATTPQQINKRRKPKSHYRFKKFSSSDCIINNRSRVSPKNTHRVLHRSFDGASFQNVVNKSDEDSLYINICKNGASVENANANSLKNIIDDTATATTTRRHTKVFIENNVKGVSKVLDEAAAAAQKKHQEKVMKGVQEVCVNGTTKEYFSCTAPQLMMINYAVSLVAALFRRFAASLTFCRSYNFCGLQN